MQGLRLIVESFTDKALIIHRTKSNIKYETI